MTRQTKVIYIILGLVIFLFLWWFFIHTDSVDEYERLTPEDCTRYETYDPVDGSCYFECDTDQECDAIEAKIQEQIDEYVVFFEENIDHDSFTEKKPNLKEEELDALIFSGSSDIEPSMKQSKKEELWNKITVLIPEEYTNQIERFALFNDPSEEEGVAYVERSSYNPKKWDLFLNRPVFYVDGFFDQKEFVRTVLHEFMHIITLSDSSLDGRFYSKGVCPTVDLDEGCLKKSAMLLNFIDQFWDREDHDSQDNYQKNIFVSEYASSNAVEDIAESFMFFILKDKQKGSTLREEKINFFYQYDNMVEFRKEVRQNLLEL